ncbi:MAG: prepilin peptidase [Acidobacteriota bacterium]|nr:prepilin peptidase [Acidobacteriota bacterium]
MDTPALLFEVVGLVAGLLFGSFLNVCIARLPEHRSVVTPRSHCLHCGHMLAWYDNVPVLSWLLLRGRCRNCGQPIGVRYPLVELATGLWFALGGHQLAVLVALPATAISTDHRVIGALDVLSFLIVGFLLIGLLVMDWETFLLPDAFTLTGTAIAAFVVCCQAIFTGTTEHQVLLPANSIHLNSAGAGRDAGNVFLTGPEAVVFGRLAAIVLVTVLLLAIRAAYRLVRRREGLGLGDVKLMAMMTAFLGLGPSLLALFVGVLLASGYGVVLLLRGRAGGATRLPLGSFLALGGLLAARFGTTVWNSYTAFLQ